MDGFVGFWNGCVKKATLNLNTWNEKNQHREINQLATCWNFWFVLLVLFSSSVFAFAHAFCKLHHNFLLSSEVLSLSLSENLLFSFSLCSLCWFKWKTKKKKSNRVRSSSFSSSLLSQKTQQQTNQSSFSFRKQFGNNWSRSLFIVISLIKFWKSSSSSETRNKKRNREKWKEELCDFFYQKQHKNLVLDLSRFLFFLLSSLFNFAFLLHHPGSSFLRLFASPVVSKAKSLVKQTNFFYFPHGKLADNQVIFLFISQILSVKKTKLFKNFSRNNGYRW